MVNATNQSAFSNAFQESFSGVDFGTIGKNIVFVGYYINDLLIRLFTAVFKSLNLPFTNYQSSIVLVIIYMVALYIILILVENLKPILKWLIAGAIIWLLIGFFKF